MLEFPTSVQRAPQAYELRFESLHHAGRALSFPCDDHGAVPLDTLSERARANYLFARAVVGRDYHVPTVCAQTSH
jgi:hypothetical protein